MLTRSQKLTSKVEHLKETLKLLSKEKLTIEQEISKLKDAKTSYMNDTLARSIELDDKWLDDFYIQGYFDSLQDDISKHRKDTILIGPTVSQLLKLSSPYEVIYTLTNLLFDQINFAFFCINNQTEKLNNPSSTAKVFKQGCHWTLLMYSRPHKTFYHYDSIKGLNSKHAQRLARNINPDFKFVEMETKQQTNNYECGLHVLVNAKIELNKIECLNKNSMLNNIKSNNNQAEYDSTLLVNSPESVNKEKINEESSFIKVKVSRKNKQIALSHTLFKTPCQNRFSILQSNNVIEVNSEPIKDSNSKKMLKPQKLTLNLRASEEPTSTLTHNNKTVLTRQSKIKILSDSHGRHLSNMLINNLDKNYEINGNVKPNALLETVINNLENEVTDMNKNDYLVILGGTNNISRDCSESELITNLENKIKDISHTNIIMSAIPYRYDLPLYNAKIRNINSKLLHLSYRYDNVHFMKLHDLKRYNFTTHGLHLKHTGKKQYCTIIRETIDELKAHKNYCSKIPVVVSKRHNFLGKLRAATGLT